MTEVQKEEAQPKTGMEKFVTDLKMKERTNIARQLGVGLGDMTGEHMEEFTCALVYTAARRLKRDEITHDSIGDMSPDDFNELLEEVIKSLGFVDDEEAEEVSPPLELATTSDGSEPKKKSAPVSTES